MPTKGRLIGGKSAKRLEQDRIAGLEAQVADLQRRLKMSSTAYDTAIKQWRHLREELNAVQALEVQRDADVVRGSDYRMLHGQAQALREELATERKAAHELGYENANLRSQATVHKRDINMLLQENHRLRATGHVAKYNGPWPGDSGDIVDLERKLDALLGKDATKLLRQSLDVERRWSGRHA